MPGQPRAEEVSGLATLAKSLQMKAFAISAEIVTKKNFTFTRVRCSCIRTGGCVRRDDADLCL